MKFVRVLHRENNFFLHLNICIKSYTKNGFTENTICRPFQISRANLKFWLRRVRGSGAFCRWLARRFYWRSWNFECSKMSDNDQCSSSPLLFSSDDENNDLLERMSSVNLELPGPSRNYSLPLLSQASEDSFPKISSSRKKSLRTSD